MTYTAEEQKAHRKLWVEALRSGKYQQGRTVMFHDERRTMCCLGVACDASGLGTWEPNRAVSTHGLQYVTAVMNPRDKANGDNIYGLSSDVTEWLGLADTVGSHGTAQSLANLNDVGVPFTEIADIIESEPEGLIAK
jgi:hypothetical protein